jgi:Transposase IS66 family
MEPRWAQVIDVKILRKVTEYLLPGLACGGCGTVTFASPPPGLHAGAVCCGPVLNAAAVLLSCFGNVPAERSARLIGMLLGTEVSAGWVDKAVARVDARLRAAGFDDAMIAALAAEPVLAADETPVNVPDRTVPAPGPDEVGEADPEEKDGKAAAGAPHVLIVTTPDGRLKFLQALGSRRKGSVGSGIPAGFAGHLMTDGYTGCQHLLDRVAGIQQCCQHVIRRCRAVQKPGPGGVQNWAGDVIAILGEAHRAVEDARARGSTGLDQQVLDDLRERYDTAVRSGIIHNRLRDCGTATPGIRPRLPAAGLQRTGLPVHPRLRRGLDEQRQRTRRESSQAPPGRLRLLALPGHPRPLVPPAQLPGLHRRPRRHRTRCRPRRH